VPTAVAVQLRLRFVSIWNAHAQQVMKTAQTHFNEIGVRMLCGRCISHARKTPHASVK
jgi:bacterioferritin-associated ferredoxin